MIEALRMAQNDGVPVRAKSWREDAGDGESPYIESCLVDGKPEFRLRCSNGRPWSRNILWPEEVFGEWEVCRPWPAAFVKARVKEDHAREEEKIDGGLTRDGWQSINPPVLFGHDQGRTISVELIDSMLKDGPEGGFVVPGSFSDQIISAPVYYDPGNVLGQGVFGRGETRNPGEEDGEPKA